MEAANSVVIVIDQSVPSMVRKNEWSLALHATWATKGKRLISVRIGDAEVPAFLKTFRIIDLDPALIDRAAIREIVEALSPDAASPDHAEEEGVDLDALFSRVDSAIRALNDMKDDDEEHQRTRVALEGDLALLRREGLGDTKGAILVARAIGLIAEQQGDFAHAEEMYQHAVEAERRMEKPSEEAIATGLLSIGRVRERMERFDDAEEAYRASHEISLDCFGEEDVRSITAAESLALLLFKRDAVEEACDLQRVVFERTKNILGEEHPRSSSVAYGLGRILYKRGEWEESASMFRRALDGADTLSSPGSHARSTTSALALGRSLMKLGDYSSAISAFEYALENDPESHPAIYNLGIAHRRIGELTSAAEFLADAVERAEKDELKLPLAASAFQYGTVLRLLDRPKEACLELDRALECGIDVFGPSDPRTNASRYALALAKRDLGDLIGARELLLTTLELEAARVETDSPLARRSQAALLELSTAVHE